MEVPSQQPLQPGTRLIGTPQPGTQLLGTPQPGTQLIQPPPHQPGSGQMVAQQYVVTINGDFTGQQPPVNIKAIGITASLQLTCASLAVLLGVLAMLVGCVNSVEGMPIWTGLFFYMVAGILGRVAVRKRNNCSVIAYMVLSILAALASSSLITETFFIIVHESLFSGEVDHLPFPPPLKTPVGVRIAVDCTIAAIGIAEAVIAIVASAFCCRGTCCAPPTALKVEYSPAIPAGSVVVPQGQTMPHQGQTILFNPSPPPSYHAGPLPEKGGALVVDHVAGQATTPDPDTVGHDIATDTGSDEQPLVV